MRTTKLFDKFFYAVTIVVFMFQLVMPTTVFAQSEDPAADPAPTSAPVDPSTAPTEEVTPAPTDVPVDAAAPDPALANLPEDTNVVVLDENGQPMPMATQEAADAILNGDPIWCPMDVDPIPGVGGCTASFTTFNGAGGLIAALQTGDYSDAGTIYVAAGYVAAGVDKGTSITFDHSTLSTLTDLVFQGGWNPSDSNINQIFTNTDFNLGQYTTGDQESHGLVFYGWAGSLTLNNISVTDSSGGLSIDTSSADVTLDHVNVSGSGMDYKDPINAQNGAYIYTTGDVQIIDSTFNNNQGAGLVVQLNNPTEAQGDVTLTGMNVFNGNTLFGLIIDKKGSVTFEADSNTTANRNGHDGVVIDNIASDINLGGTNTFNENGGTTSGYGLSINYAIGNITLNTITADYNTGGGVYLDNTSGTDTNFIKLTGKNEFNNNYYGYGLEAYTLGDINLNNVTADGNDYDGAYLDNCSYDDYEGNCTYSGGGDVTLTGKNEFNANMQNGEDGNGLTIYTLGEINLNNVTADENYGGGAYLNNCPWVYDPETDEYSSDCGSSSDVNLTGLNEFNYNYWGSGLEIVSGGAVNLNSITASGNRRSGVELDNCQNDEGCTRSGTVSLTGKNEFNENRGLGLDVNSGGNIVSSLDSIITANGNRNVGAYLINYGSNSNPFVNLAGTNVFGLNWQDGLYIASNGGITVNNITANGNDWSGAVLMNDYRDWNTDPYSINVTGTNEFSGNGSNGLQVQSVGDIELNGVTANRNVEGDGVNLISKEWSNAGTLPNVFLTKVTANENGGNGFAYYGPPQDSGYYGPAEIVVCDSTFNDNTGYGLYIINEDGTITWDGTNTGNNIGGSDGQQNHFVPETFAGNCGVVVVPPTYVSVPSVQSVPQKGYEYVQMNGSNEADFSCGKFKGLLLYTKLVNDDFVMIPCGSSGTGTHASAFNLESSGLPAQPAGTVVSAIKFTIEDGKHIDAKNIGQILVSFKLADGETAAGYSIMFWNGIQWKKVENCFLSDGHYQSWVQHAGIYVLVKN
jgi:hypothetical protein